MTLVSKTSHVALSLRMTGIWASDSLLVIAHLRLADAPTTHEEGSPDYSLSVSGWAVPTRKAFHLSPRGPFPWAPSLGLLPKGCPLSGLEKGCAWSCLPQGQPSAEIPHFGVSRGTLLGPAFPPCKIETVITCGLATPSGLW